ncbi:MAG: ABC-type Fe3+/spermidine/putrescine transport system ATPase subunit [Sphingobacteriales bacterium]|jgi:ABC-type Fe3+/spermidine/putrescine transport system ATPase subunit
MKQLSVKNLSKTFDSDFKLSVEDVTIQEGDFLAILGGSGSGKSTLLRCLAGLEKGDTGSITWGDQVFQNTSNFKRPKKRNLNMVFQDFGLLPNLTVEQNIELGSKQSVDTQDTLYKVGLGKKGASYPHELSGGEKQRVALARALRNPKPLLLLDEPLSSIDPTLRMELRELISSVHRSTEGTSILVSHDPEDVIALANKVLILDAGKAVWFGTISELFKPTSLAPALWNPRCTVLLGEVWNHIYGTKLENTAYFVLEFSDFLAASRNEKEAKSIIPGWEMDQVGYYTPWGLVSIVQPKSLGSLVALKPNPGRFKKLDHQK